MRYRTDPMTVEVLRLAILNVLADCRTYEHMDASQIAALAGAALYDAGLPYYAQEAVGWRVKRHCETLVKYGYVHRLQSADGGSLYYLSPKGADVLHGIEAMMS